MSVSLAPTRQSATACCRLWPTATSLDLTLLSMYSFTTGIKSACNARNSCRVRETVNPLMPTVAIMVQLSLSVNQSARMSKITNDGDGLTRSGTGRFIAVHMATVGIKGLRLKCMTNNGVTMGWLLRLVTGGGSTGKGAPDSSKFLMNNFKCLCLLLLNNKCKKRSLSRHLVA